MTKWNSKQKWKKMGYELRFFTWWASQAKNNFTKSYAYLDPSQKREVSLRCESLPSCRISGIRIQSSVVFWWHTSVVQFVTLDFVPFHPYAVPLNSAWSQAETGNHYLHSRFLPTYQETGWSFLTSLQSHQDRCRDSQGHPGSRSWMTHRDSPH